jgi:RNA polymerase sigma-70 factor (ECF subfamily)
MNRESAIQAQAEQELLFSLSGLEIRNVLPKQNQSRALPQNKNNYWDFWQLWKSHKEYFYTCCLQWMGGNSHDAEDVLSQVMLKAWNVWPKYASKTIHPKAWLTQVIYNFCMDVHRKRKREAQLFAKHLELAAKEEFIESNILHLEMWTYLHQRIESLPDKLRHPFVLRYILEKSYSDIAKQLTISEENVRKRIKKARSILQKQLNKYLAGEENTSLDSISPFLKRAIPTVKEFKFEEEFQFDEIVMCNWESSITTKSQNQEINYKVTVICLETLPHYWYSSTNCLDWR